MAALDTQIAAKFGPNAAVAGDTFIMFREGGSAGAAGLFLALTSPTMLGADDHMERCR